MRGLGSGHVTCGPMRGLEINFTGRGPTDRQTDGHCDSMTNPAQRAESVKMRYNYVFAIFFNHLVLIQTPELISPFYPVTIVNTGGAMKKM